MSEKRTRIVLVLDQSGSMGPVRKEAVGAFNEALDDIVKNADDGGETTVSLLTFNHDVRQVFLNGKVGEVHHLTEAQYPTMGSTALRDAIGCAIDSVQEVDDLEGDAAALIIVVTDGYENASQKWSQVDLAEKIQELESKGTWTFTIMCANVDVKKVAQDFNLHEGNCAMFVADAHGTQVMGHTMSNSLGSYMSDRKVGATASKEFYNESN